MEESTTAAKSAKKRTRKVSSMSQEQIRAKRHQDREAQRAFRERSKLRIQTLEQEVATLKTTQHIESLEEALVTLRQENRELKDQLERIHEISRPLADSRESDHAALLVSAAQSNQTPSNARTPTTRIETSISKQRQLQLPSEASEDALYSTQHQHSPRWYPSTLRQLPGEDSEAYLVSHQTQKQRPQKSGLDQQSFGYVVSPATDSQLLTSDEHENNTPPSRNLHVSDSGHVTISQNRLDEDNSRYSPIGMWQKTNLEIQDSTLGARLDFRGHDYFTPHESRTSSVQSAEDCVWANPEAMDQVARHAILPKHFAATCPLDQILLNFLSAQQMKAAEGTPLELLLEPRMPAISGLIDPSLKTTHHSTSRVMVDIVSTFKDTNLKEQLGFLYTMYSTMRWQIAPTHETFHDMPSWLQPTVMQVIVPHPAWIDNVPWPQVRDLLIQDPVKYSFLNFSEVYARSVELEWPFDNSDAVIPPDHHNSQYLLNPLFVKNIRRLECWSVRELFTERFPELAALMVP